MVSFSDLSKLADFLLSSSAVRLFRLLGQSHLTFYFSRYLPLLPRRAEYKQDKFMSFHHFGWLEYNLDRGSDQTGFHKFVLFVLSPLENGGCLGSPLADDLTFSLAVGGFGKLFLRLLSTCPISRRLSADPGTRPHERVEDRSPTRSPTARRLSSEGQPTHLEKERLSADRPLSPPPSGRADSDSTSTVSASRQNNGYSGSDPPTVTARSVPSQVLTMRTSHTRRSRQSRSPASGPMSAEFAKGGRAAAA